MVEEIYTDFDAALGKFKSTLETRGCPVVYKNTEPRTYTVYISYWNANEKALLESLPEYAAWIENGDLVIQDINELPTEILIVE